jgi:hypothetical protein
MIDSKDLVLMTSQGFDILAPEIVEYPRAGVPLTCVIGRRL